LLKNKIFGLVFILFIVLVASCNYTSAPPLAQTTHSQTGGGGLPASQAPLDEPVPTQHKVFAPAVQSGQGAPDGEGSAPALNAVDPRIEIKAAPTNLKIGDFITLEGTPVDLGLPYYELILRDEGVQDAEPVVRVTYENVVTPLSGTSAVLDLVSAQGEMGKAIFVLRAKAAGVTTVTIQATGEIQTADSQAARWGGTGSGDILITVAE
jgi:hypothetical protein